MLLVTLLENLVSGKGMWKAGYGSKKKSDSTSSFNKLWNLQILSKRIQI